MVIKAVIFDIGGVVMRSPMLAIAQYEKENNLPPNYINCIIANIGPSGAFQRLERGEISLFPFYKAFSSELSALQGKIWYEQYCENRGLKCPPLPDDIQIDGRQLFGRMMRESAVFDDLVVRAIKQLRATGRYRVIALTNNYSRSRETAAIDAPSGCDIEAELEFLGWQEGPVTPQLRELFDDFCDSSTFGLRKPDPAFYLLACKRNQIVPSEAIFLDDIGYNLKTAKDLGMKTIQVRIGKSEQALQELGQLLGLSLTENQMRAQL